MQTIKIHKSVLGFLLFGYSECVFIRFSCIYAWDSTLRLDFVSHTWTDISTEHICLPVRPYITYPLCSVHFSNSLSSYFGWAQNLGFWFQKRKKKLRRIKIKTNVLFSVFFFSSFSLCWKTDKTERKSEPFDSILWHIFSCFVHLFCSFAISAVLFKLQRFWWRFLYILCFVCIRY